MVDNITNKLFLGDNLSVLKKQIPDSSVDLIYLDPPFNSNRNYFIHGSKDQKSKSSEPSFKDKWSWDCEVERAYLELCDSLEEKSHSKMRNSLSALCEICGKGGLFAYLLFMFERLIELNRCMRDTGSIYLHCDPKISVHLRIVMNIIFGEKCYLNNIVWCYGLGGSSKRYWSRKHDDILWYCKNERNYYFQPILIPATSNKMKGQNKKATDYWLIPAINNKANERCGYPTQKPIALLERIILSSSREGELVLDPFCGSGTTMLVADNLNRRWIGIDNNPQAIRIAKERIQNQTAKDVK